MFKLTESRKWSWFRATLVNFVFSSVVLCRTLTFYPVRFHLAGRMFSYHGNKDQLAHRDKRPVKMLQGAGQLPSGYRLVPARNREGFFLCGNQLSDTA